MTLPPWSRRFVILKIAWLCWRARFGSSKRKAQRRHRKTLRQLLLQARNQLLRRKAHLHKPRRRITALARGIRVMFGWVGREGGLRSAQILISVSAVR